MLKEIFNSTNYEFNIYAIPVLITALFIFYFGSFVFVKNRKELKNVTFFILTTNIFIWLFFALFMWMIAGVIADVQEPIDSYSQPEEIAKHERIETNVGLISPVQLYNEASDIILDPDRRTLHGVLQTAILNKTSLPDALNPVSFRQSLTLIWPHVVVIIGLTAICFAASYIRFMREEIRST